LRRLHAASVLGSALLLFLIEPMVAKALLPLYGGSPAVWNTCLLFFQGLLLLGYAWAHFGARRLGPRGQLIAHAVVLLGTLALLPPRVPTEGPGASAWPVPSLLAALAISVGPQFFVLASNSSLVQRWHALRAGESPYFLYAASNVGSFVALVAYPFLVEPAAGTRAQLRFWSFGYTAFVVLSGVVLAAAWRGAPVVTPPASRPLPSGARLRWAVRAAVPSSLLLAVSLAIATDVASIPLLWVVPLAIYLATFVIAFWPRVGYPRRLLVTVGAVLISLILTWPNVGRGDLKLGLGLPLLTLLVGCWVCHADLARDRPDPEHVTEYYLWIAIGGFAGGVFGNLIAPRLFNSVAELPLSLALLALMFSLGDDHGAALLAALRRPVTWLRLAATAVPFVAWGVIAPRVPTGRWDSVPFVLLLAAMALWRVPGQFAAACASAALVSTLGVIPGVRTLEARRSFFGVVRVREWDGKRRLVHGTTWHGAQRVAPFEPEPLLYYAAMSPLSRALVLQRGDAHVGVVGLGTGSFAYYAKPEQSIRYYEIDPIVEPLARRWFTFLKDSRGHVDVQLGDARLSLRDAPDRSFDFLLVDAFSSDAIPIHLLTVEAVQLYLDKLVPDGLLVLHVTNVHLDLVPVVRAIAHRLGLAAAHIEWSPDKEDSSYVEAVALARTREPLQKLLDRGWDVLDDGREVLWTDDRSNLLSVIVR
jgi:hypothetical protein